jgi:hypothetical protein
MWKMANYKFVYIHVIKESLSMCLMTDFESAKTTVRGYTCRSTRTHYPDSEPTSLCSFSLILRALHYKQQIPAYNLWFDPIGTHLLLIMQSTQY